MNDIPDPNSEYLQELNDFLDVERQANLMSSATNEIQEEVKHGSSSTNMSKTVQKIEEYERNER